MRIVAMALIAACLVAGMSAAGDWPQWMGPSRHGVAAPSLGGAPDFTVTPEVVWSNDAAPEAAYDYSSPIVAGSNVYLFVTYSDHDSTTPVSLRPDTWRDWVGKLKGKNNEPLPPAVQTALLPLAATNFPSLSALRKALGDAGFPDTGRIEPRHPILNRNTLRNRHAMVCLQLASGLEIWRKEWAATSDGVARYGTACTPLHDNGRLFLIDSVGVARALNAATGDTVWERPLGPTGAWYYPNQHSPILVGKRLIFQAAQLTALDPATGEVFWKQEAVADCHSSPAQWSRGGKEYIICNRYKVGSKGDAGKSTPSMVCVDAADGRVVWQIPDGSTDGSPCAVADPRGGDAGLLLFTKAANLRRGYDGKGDIGVWCLSGEKAEHIADIALRCGSSSPVTDGKLAWFWGPAGAPAEVVAFDLAKREVVARTRYSGNNDDYASPILADGHLLVADGRFLYVYDAYAKTMGHVARHPLPKTKWHTPAYANGYLVVRDEKVVCYRFGRGRAQSPPAEPERDASKEAHQ